MANSKLRNIAKVTNKLPVNPTADGLIESDDLNHLSNQVALEENTLSTFQQCLKNDLDCFINPSEFAINVTYNAVKNNVVKTIPGIFTHAFESAGPDTEMIVQSLDPILRVKECDLPGGRVRPGDWVIVEGKQYTVKENQPDGTGVADLRLKVR